MTPLSNEQRDEIGLCFKQYEAFIKATVNKLCSPRDREEVFDICCFKFSTIYLKRDITRPFAAFLASCIKYTAIDYYRSQDKNNTNIFSENYSNNKELGDIENVDEVEFILDNISSYYRNILNLHYLNDFKYEDMLECTKKSNNTTVKTRATVVKNIKKAIMRSKEIASQNKFAILLLFLLCASLTGCISTEITTPTGWHVKRISLGENTSVGKLTVTTQPFGLDVENYSSEQKLAETIQTLANKLPAVPIVP